MSNFIDISEAQYRQLWSHLLPPKKREESAAFMFCEFQTSQEELVLKVSDILLIPDAGFNVQEEDYIELSDETRISVIKKAHKDGLALVELHSHPFAGLWCAAFSRADMRGFEETLPHMWWRLPDRPYGAIVAAFDGFDSIVWRRSPAHPEQLTALRVDGQILKPTNQTIGGINGIR